MRSAGSPTITPMAIATTAASSGANGNGTCSCCWMRVREKAPTPARVSCAKEIWPVNPVTTTCESAMTAITRVVMTAARIEPCVTASEPSPSTTMRAPGTT